MATDFPIVGIGASAGGVEALEAFFAAYARGERHGLRRGDATSIPRMQAGSRTSSRAARACRWPPSGTATRSSRDTSMCCRLGAISFYL